jgi:hypothetical protein
VATFTDCEGRDWHLRLTVGDLPKLRDLGFDLNGFAAGEKLGEVLFADTERFVRIMLLLSRSPLSFEEAAAGFDGPTLEAAGMALLECFADFSPRSRLAQWMKGKFREGMARMDDLLISQLESNAAAGNSPGRPASTPAR